MAKTLVKTMSRPWNPEKYHDQYEEKLLAWIERKKKTKSIKHKVIHFTSPKETKNLIHLMKKSIAAMQEQHSKKGTIIHIKSRLKK